MTVDDVMLLALTIQMVAKQIPEILVDYNIYLSTKLIDRTKAGELEEISDSNSALIVSLKKVKDKAFKVEYKVLIEITKRNYDGSKEENPVAYQKLCDIITILKTVVSQLDISINQIDMVNWRIAQIIDIAYHNESKCLEESDICSIVDNAKKVDFERKGDNTSIIIEYRLWEKIEYDVLPSLDIKQKEIDLELEKARGYREVIIKDNNLKYAKTISRLSYKENEDYILSLESAKKNVEQKKETLVRLADALRNPRVTDDKGIITIVKIWKNKGKLQHSNSGMISQTETSVYKNAAYREETISIGKNSNMIYSHHMRLYFCLLGFERKSSIVVGKIKLKNVIGANLLNFKVSGGYKRRTYRSDFELAIDGNADLFKCRENASVVVNNNEYVRVSAEASILEGTTSLRIEGNRKAAVGASSHIAQGKAAVYIGGATVAKVEAHSNDGNLRL